MKTMTMGTVGTSVPTGRGAGRIGRAATLTGGSITYLYEWTGAEWEPLERFSGPDKQNACYSRDDMQAKGVPADFFGDGELC